MRRSIVRYRILYLSLSYHICVTVQGQVFHACLQGMKIFNIYEKIGIVLLHVTGNMFN